MTGQEPDILHYTITGASDWPMFIFMVGLMGIMFTIIQALVALLIRTYNKAMLKQMADNHQAVLNRIATHRKADSEHCQECRSSHDVNKKDFRDAILREFKALWENVMSYCKAVGVAPIKRKDINGLSEEGK
jgi:predicted membrane protein